MNTKRNTLIFSLVIVLVLAGLVAVGRAQEPAPDTQPGMGTAFTYQGRLTTNGEAANGAFEFRFALYDDSGGSAQVGVSVTRVISVTGGTFTTNLDFGDVFTGDARYLEIAVRPQGSADDYSTFSPRQPLTPAPYALYAPHAGAVDWDGITGVPPDIADGDDVGGGIQSIVAGGGLAGGGTGAAITLTVAFTGSGSLDAAARGDHHHDSAYPPLAHTHDGHDVTSAVPSATLAFSATQAPWSGIAGIPAGFSDGVDDDTTYTPGMGLTLADTEFSVDLNAVAPLSHTHSFTAPDVLKYFEEELAIPTNGAQDWEFFTIGSDSYLAVANGYNGYTFNIDSKIYRWNGASFVQAQSIPTNNASDWEFFTIGSDSYLAVANTYNGSTHNLDSKIYRWNGASFTETQSIPTNGASDWEFFTIGSDSYLAVANRRNDSTSNIDSKIYRWNGSSFTETQSIPTNGAFDWEFFTIGSDSYLAVANYYDDSTHNVDSKIYRWNGSSFIEAQSIPTNGTWDWEFFTIGSDSYLAVVNDHNDSTYNVDSKIYRWNGTNFIETQSILTNGATGWKFFTIGSDYYLAVANQYNGSTHNINSKIYKATLQTHAGTTYLWGQNGSDVYYNDGNVGIGTTAPWSALQVAGYVQLDTLTAAPPSVDCDDPAEEGRMKVDPGSEILYICMTSGWVTK